MNCVVYPGSSCELDLLAGHELRKQKKSLYINFRETARTFAKIYTRRHTEKLTSGASNTKKILWTLTSTHLVPQFYYYGI
jgi:hypothetical protein